MSQRRGLRVGVTPSAAGFEKIARELDFGTTVNNDSVMKNTAYYAGIRIIAENFASLPKSVKCWGNRGIIAAPEHDINRLLHRPNRYTNEFVFWNTMAVWVKDWGNAYALIIRDRAGRPIELHQAHPAGVDITMTNGKKYYRIRSTRKTSSSIPEPTRGLKSSTSWRSAWMASRA